MWKRIQDCEKRIQQNREELNRLMDDFLADNDEELYRVKIKHLQREVHELENEIADLKEVYGRRKPQAVQSNNMYNQASVQPRVQQPIMWQNPVQPQQPVMKQASMQATPQQPVMQQRPIHAASANQNQPASADVEKIVGKSLMGVFASILIFVSLIVFGTLVVPLLNDAAKIALMFTVSLIFAVAGNLLLLKDSGNKWYLSIAGCGMGAVYVSLLMTRIYFNAISDFALYFLIFIWAIVICVLSRLRSKLFLVIGQSGIFVSMIFGVIHCTQLDDGGKLLFLVFFFLLAEGVFYVSHMQKEYLSNLLNHIFMFVSLIVLVIGTSGYYGTGETAALVACGMTILLALTPIVLSMTYFTYEKLSDAVAFGLLNSGYLILAMVSFHEKFGEYNVITLILVLMLMVGLELIHGWKFKYEKELKWGRGIFGITLMIALLYEVVETKYLFENTSFMVPAILFLLYGFIRTKELYKIPGLFLAFICIFIPMDVYNYLICGSLIFLTVIALQCLYKEQYATWIKVVTYPTLLLFIIINMLRLWDTWNAALEGIEQFLIIVGVMAVINLCLMKIPLLHMHLKTKDDENSVLLEGGIIHIILMLISLGCIAWIERGDLHFISIVMGVILFIANIYEMMIYHKGTWSSIYIGGKLLILVMVILGSFEAPDVIFSIVMLIFAGAFVVIGFGAEIKYGILMKPLRICGLVLSLVSTVKLLLIDIYYDDKIMLAVNLFLSGIICFAISFIYNRVDKKILQKK